MLTVTCRGSSDRWVGPKHNFIDHNFLKVRTCRNKRDESYSLNGGVGRKLCDEAAGSEF